MLYHYFKFAVYKGFEPLSRPFQLGMFFHCKLINNVVRRVGIEPTQNERGGYSSLSSPILSRRILKIVVPVGFEPTLDIIHTVSACYLNLSSHGTKYDLHF